MDWSGDLTASPARHLAGRCVWVLLTSLIASGGCGGGAAPGSGSATASDQRAIVPVQEIAQETNAPALDVPVERALHRPTRRDIERTWVLTGALAHGTAAAREDAVEELATLQTHRAFDALAQALYDEDAEVQQAAVDGLADIHTDASALALAPLLSANDPDLREMVVDALADIGGAAAAGLLEQALSDDDPRVRDTAQDYLDELRRQSSNRSTF